MEIIKVRLNTTDIERLTESIIAKVDLSDQRLYGKGVYYSISDFSNLISPQFKIELFKDEFETTVSRFRLEFYNKEGNEVKCFMPFSIEENIRNHFYKSHGTKKSISEKSKAKTRIVWS